MDAGAAFTGGAGNDLFIASDKLVDGASVQTWTAADQIDGGAGTNTFQVTSGADDIVNPAGATVTNIQVMKVIAAEVGVDLDTTDFTGLQSLSVSTSGAEAAEDGEALTGFKATSADTTNILFTVVDQGESEVNIEGGNDVSVTATKATEGGKITIADAAGDVVVSVTGAAYKGTGNAEEDSAKLGAITVDGGATISVTQVATSDASKAAKDEETGTITQGDVIITAGDETTEVTVKQDAAQEADDYEKAVTAVNPQVTVTFKALEAGETTTVDGLTFTAGDEDLTAQQVAQAFANLTADAILPGDASGDTQSGGEHPDGTYSGDLNGNWISAAADGDKVVFTYVGVDAFDEIDSEDLDVDDGAVAPTKANKTVGVEGVDGKTGVMGIVAGAVTVAGDSALATVSIDAYGADSEITGTANTALETLNLANGGDFDVESAAATLALNADNVDGEVDIQSGTTTLNANITDSSGDDDVAVTELSSVSVKTLTVTGDGQVEGGYEGGLNAVETIDTTGFTGTADFAIDGTQTAYTGGEGVDNLWIEETSDGTKLVSQDLGGGNDTLDITDLTVGSIQAIASGVVFDAGDGDDTVTVTAAVAAEVSLTSISANTFLSRFANFETMQFEVTDTNYNIGMGNLGFDSITLVGDEDDSAGVITLKKAADGTTVKVVGDDLEGGVTVEVDKATASNPADAVTLEIADNDDIDVGDFTANNVSTINIVATDSDTTDGWGVAHDVNLIADKASTVNITGNAASLDLDLDAGNDELSEIEASTFEGGIDVDLEDIANQAVSVYGGQGVNTLVASNQWEDELVGGAANDTLTAGANSSVLLGGAGADLFIVNSEGNKASFLDVTAQATIVFAFATNVTKVTADDTITFVYDGIEYTATLTAAVGADVGEIAALDAALAAAVDVDGNALGAAKVTAAVNESENTITLTSSAGKSLNGGKVVTNGADADDPGAATITYTYAEGTLSGISFSTILDFGTGDDLVQLFASDGETEIASLVKASGISTADGKLLDNINAAIKAAAVTVPDADDVSAAAWFVYQGSSYIVIDNTNNVDDQDDKESDGEDFDPTADVFTAGSDVVIKLAGVDLNDGISFNDTYGTIGLI